MFFYHKNKIFKSNSGLLFGASSGSEDEEETNFGSKLASQSQSQSRKSFPNASRDRTMNDVSTIDESANLIDESDNVIDESTEDGMEQGKG